MLHCPDRTCPDPPCCFVRIGLVPTGHRFGALDRQSCGGWGRCPIPPGEGVAQSQWCFARIRLVTTAVLLCTDRPCADRTPLWGPRTPKMRRVGSKPHPSLLLTSGWDGTIAYSSIRQRWSSLRMYILPLEKAGVVCITSSNEFFASTSYLLLFAIIVHVPESSNR